MKVGDAGWERRSWPSKIACQAYKIITSSISNWTLWTVNCSWAEFPHCLLYSFRKDTHSHTHTHTSVIRSIFDLEFFCGCWKKVDFPLDADEGSIFCPAHTHSHSSWHKHQSSQTSWLYCNVECGKPQGLKSLSERGYAGIYSNCSAEILFSFFFFAILVQIYQNDSSNT